ncbi:FAD-dependent oxidoreductase [Sutterella sp.]|uniref:FAD-dependent oxidoreductase n=1 Tax=Sutterella sp. TaxID=1981025 RepID=UPI0026E11337|nr:FAD-dependent oxidoreductase [Sutterella sp.]MDO5530684.1 FAD-dependent oxidoreductase [Sutterella sp.]
MNIKNLRKVALGSALALAFSAPALAADIMADVVVIGAGAAGSAAAVAAQKAGAKTVLLEKTGFQMGAGSFAGGMFAADSSQQKAAGKVVSKEWLFNEYHTLSGGFQNNRLVRRIIDEAGRTVDFLCENGAELKLVSAGTGGGYAHVGKPATLHGYQHGGAKALQGLLKSFKAAGGTAYFSTPATELITDKDGRVTGVKAKGRGGKTLEIDAKAVVIATGGFGGNAEMMKEFLGEPYTPGEVTQNTGDGIRMAWKAGAGRRGTDVTQYFWMTFPQSEIGEFTKITDNWWSLTDLTRYPNLRVNLEGDRFGDESNVTLYSVHGAELGMQSKQTEFVILDQGMVERVAKGGFAAIEEQYKAFKGKREFFMEFNEPNDTEELSKAENTPFELGKYLDQFVGKTATVYKADTIEGLAKAIGVPVGNFLASVEQYNQAAATGKDELFFADGKRFIPVKKGPFYAVRFIARNLGTLGGIRINERIEACRTDGTVIPGLWAAGADAGGMYGKAYVDFEGGTLGFAYTSGRLAGEGAAAYAKSLK